MNKLKNREKSFNKMSTLLADSNTKFNEQNDKQVFRDSDLSASERLDLAFFYSEPLVHEVWDETNQKNKLVPSA